MQDFKHYLTTCDAIEGRRLAIRKGQFLDDMRPDGEPVLVLVEEGSVEVLGRSGTLVNKLAPGSVFGVVNLFSGEAMPSRLRAVEDAILVLFPKSAVRQAMDKDLAFLHAYCRLLNDRLGFLMSRISLLSLKSNRQRVAAWVLDGMPGLFKRREELAGYLAISRSALFRELSFFTDVGALRVEGDVIEVLDEGKLMEVLR